MNEMIAAGVVAASLGFVAWFIQHSIKRNQDHVDLKLGEISAAVAEIRKEQGHQQEVNNDAHGRLWEAHRTAVQGLGERVAKLEAVQGNCRTCRNGGDE